MYFAQYYLDCLSQASYMIGDESSGRAVVIDPRRDISEYLDDAAEHGLSIEGTVLTHFHADFLSGHLELADATGAWIGYGAAAHAEYPIRHLADGERIDLGTAEGVVLKIMHTPGHTPESISVLVYEHAADEAPYGVLTGDALFIGDVGRPDLLVSVGRTSDELATMLYHSVQDKLMGLADQVRVFPAHGAGSACGKNLSTETQSTIGEQRRSNYACHPMSRERFVAAVTEGQSSAPAYFAYDAVANRRQRTLFTEHGPSEITFDELKSAITEGAVLLDSRDPVDFAAGHLTGSISVPLDGRFAETAGMILRPQDALVVIAPARRQAEVVTRLARIGFDNVVGYLADVRHILLVDAPAEFIEHSSKLTSANLTALLTDNGFLDLVDVRNIGELAAGSIPGARNIPLSELPARKHEIPANTPVVVYCASGWRSSVAASYLRRCGFTDVSDLIGGYEAWQLQTAAAAR